MSILAVWREMVDPTQQGGLCEVAILDEMWMHVMTKHVCNPEEPWDFWLSPDLATRLRAAVAGSQGLLEKHRDVLREASAIVEKDARSCLARPLMLVYRRSEEGKTFSWGMKTWELVLHEGASLIVRWHGQRGLAWTCFFDGNVAKWWRPGEWWIGLARKRIRRYCTSDKGLALPSKSAVFELENKETGATARHTRVAFVTPKSWGFRSDDPGASWGGWLKDWKPVAPAAAQAYPRLRPKIRYEVEHVSR